MKKQLLYSLLILILIMLVAGCRSKKNLPTVIVHDQTIIKTAKKDSIVKKSETVINNSVNDTIKQKVPKAVPTGDLNCDSIAEQRVLDVLRGLNTKKTSGNNEYGFFFDEKKRELVAFANFGETKSHNNESTKESSDHSAEVQKKEVPVEVLVEVPVEYIPWWVEILAWIGAASVLFGSVFLTYKIARK
ncbi:MAG TPA: hypothetical protein VF581_07690 [Flavobacterium sp.]|jgi:hypothetical protein